MAHRVSLSSAQAHTVKAVRSVPHTRLSAELPPLTVWATGATARLNPARRTASAGGKELTRYEPCLAWLPPPAPRPGRTGGPCTAGPVCDRRVPGTVGPPDAAHPAGAMDVLHPPRRPDQEVLGLPGVPGAAGRERHRRHPLRRPL